MIALVLACVLTTQHGPFGFVQLQHRPDHQVAGISYRIEDFELEFAVESWVIDQVVADRPWEQPWALTLEFYQRNLPQVVSNNVKLIYRGDYKATMAAIRNLSRLDRGDFHWVLWLSRAHHSQVRVAVVKAIRGRYACSACGGEGRCRGFVPGDGPGKATTCRVCEWSEGSHSYLDACDLKCIWCDGIGAFGAVGEVRRSLPGRR